MPRDIDLDPPISHAIADGWANFAETVLPSIGGTEHAQAHIAFHFGAMYVLQIAQHVIAQRSGEEVPLVLGMLDAELDEFMKSHAVAIQ
jgi:predicted membrane-bound spermidine synthase